MKKFLIHKLLPILFIFLISLFLLITFSYCSSYTSLNGNTMDFPSFVDKLDEKNSPIGIIYSRGGFYYLLITRIYDNGSDFNHPRPYISGNSIYCHYTYRYSLVNGSWKSIDNSSSSISYTFEDIYCSTIDLKDMSGNVIFKSNFFDKPSFITTKEELSSGKFDTLKIDAGDLDLASDEFGLAVFDVTSSTGILGIPNFKPVKTFILNSKSDYLRSIDLQLFYYIPQSSLQLDISNGKKYMFCLVNLDDYTLYNSIIFTVGGMTSEEEIKNAQDVTNDKLDEQTNAIKDQTEAMKEQTETNKNIFEKIGDILSYINPFSENFFVYKLISLLIDAIKSLFIPSDDFFSNYFNELKDWFSDRLGFLFYPFEVVIDILTKILSVNFNEPVFNVPNINEPFSGSKLISATSFNLNDLVSDGAFKVIHEIYLVCLDAFIVFELVNLFRRKYEEVTTK